METIHFLSATILVISLIWALSGVYMFYHGTSLISWQERAVFIAHTDCSTSDEAAELLSEVCPANKNIQDFKMRTFLGRFYGFGKLTN